MFHMEVQEVMLNPLNKPLPPHTYPWWVRIFAFAIIAVVVYALVEYTPALIRAGRAVHLGEEALARKEYTRVIEQFTEVLSITPTSKRARIGLMEAYFTNDDSSDDDKGRDILKNLKLDKKEVERIKKILPPAPEGKFYFFSP